MRDVCLTFSLGLYLASLPLVTACDSQRQMVARDILLDAFLEQPGGDDEQTVHIAFHRDGTYARRSLDFFVMLEADARAPVEHVSLGPIVPENEHDGFTDDQHTEVAYAVTGRIRLAPCPNGAACTNVFSCVVSSSSPTPDEITLVLRGSFSVDDTWRGSFQPEMWLEP